MLLLDTLPLVDFFKEKSEVTEKVILDSEEGKEELAISVITLSELYYILSREKGEGFASACMENIKPYIETINANEKICEEAGKLKFRYSRKGPKKGMPLADCIIAATAMEKGATILTRDPHFEKIKELKVRWA